MEIDVEINGNLFLAHVRQNSSGEEEVYMVEDEFGEIPLTENFRQTIVAAIYEKRLEDKAADEAIEKHDPQREFDDRLIGD